MSKDADPRRICLLGDTHANTSWTCDIIEQAVGLGASLVLQLGDFGYWPNFKSGRRFLTIVEACLAMHEVPLWFVDGNHEDHLRLHSAKRSSEPKLISDHITHLSRGARWTWGDTTWLAIGGATSVDRLWRRDGVDWFEQESLTAYQEEDIAAAGHADIVVAHDAPWGVEFLVARNHLDIPPEDRGEWPRDDLRDSDNHMRRLRGLLDEVQPRRWFHGHHHVKYNDVLGSCTIHGLAKDDGPFETSALLVDATGEPLIG